MTSAADLGAAVGSAPPAGRRAGAVDAGAEESRPVDGASCDSPAEAVQNAVRPEEIETAPEGSDAPGAPLGGAGDAAGWRRRRPRRDRRGLVWLAFLGGGALATAGAVVPVGSGQSQFVQDCIAVLVAAAGAAAVLAGVRMRRPTHRFSWYLIALALLLIAAANALMVVVEAGLARDTFAVWAAPARTAASAVLVVALMAMLWTGRGRAPAPGIDNRAGSRDALADWMDSLLVGIGAGLVVWVALVDRTTRNPLPANPSEATPWWMPAVLAVVLIVLLTRLLLRGWRGVALGLGVLATCSLIVADLGPLLAGGMEPSPVRALAWTLAGLGVPVLWGASALHPSMRAVTKPVASTVHPSGDVPVPVVPTRRVARGLAARGAARAVVPVALVSIVLLVIPGTLLVQAAWGRPLALGPAAIATAAVFVLVTVRMAVQSGQVLAARRDAARLDRDLAHARTHDHLTGLADRAEIVRELKGVLGQARRTDSTAALLLVDLAGFARLNDQHGHALGDQVLQAVARRISAAALPAPDRSAGRPIGRVSANAFAVVLFPVAGRAGAVAAASRLQLSVAEPIALSRGVSVRTHPCIGVALSCAGVSDPYVLLHEAEVALRRAKASGPGRTEVFDEPLRRERERTTELHDGLRQALHAGQLVTHYEPEFALGDLAGLDPATLHEGLADEQAARACGYALRVHWERPGVGLMPLTAFLANADDADLVADVEAWALAEACRCIAGWSQASDDVALSVAVPISARSLVHTRLLDDITAALDSSLLAPHQLVLEITDPRVLGDALAYVTLERLHAMRVQIAVTGFGTSAGSLLDPAAGLADRVVIDCRAVRGHTHAPEAVLALLVEAAHAAGSGAIADGVGEVAELIALRQAGVDRVRGNLLSHPAAGAVIDRRRAVRPELMSVD